MADGRVEDEIIFSRAKNKNCPAENSTEQFFVFGNDTKDAEIFHSPRNLYQRTQNFFRSPQNQYQRTQNFFHSPCNRSQEHKIFFFWEGGFENGEVKLYITYVNESFSK